jgi:hypothetical protein
MSQLRITIKELSWHRNGVGGKGFYAIHFIDHDQTGSVNKDGEFRDAEFFGIVFERESYCACIQLNQPGDFTVQFGINSWRGDTYKPYLRKAINEMISSGSIKLGPFGIPTK